MADGAEESKVILRAVRVVAVDVVDVKHEKVPHPLVAHATEIADLWYSTFCQSAPQHVRLCARGLGCPSHENRLGAQPELPRPFATTASSKV